MLRILVNASILLVLSAAAIQAQQRITAGVYESLILAVESDGTLTGYFKEGTGDDGKGNPRFSCIFFFRGEAKAEELFEVRTWHPAFPDEVIDGELRRSELGGKPAVNLRLFGEHGGCWNVAPALKDEEGVDFELTTRGTWKSMRMVSAERAYFHSSADPKARQRAYVVKNDIVFVFDKKGDWMDVQFLSGSGKPTRGWMPTTVFYGLDP
jgi:hypothetical protein